MIFSMRRIVNRCLRFSILRHHPLIQLFVFLNRNGVSWTWFIKSDMNSLFDTLSSFVEYLVSLGYWIISETDSVVNFGIDISKIIFVVQDIAFATKDMYKADKGLSPMEEFVSCLFEYFDNQQTILGKSSSVNSFNLELSRKIKFVEHWTSNFKTTKP